VTCPSIRANLVPRLRRLRTRTPRHTSLISASRAQPLLRRQLQLPIQLRARLLPVDEVAEATPHTPLSTVQPATRLPEVRHRTQLAVDRPRRIPPAIQGITRRLRTVLVLEARVHVADQVIVVVVAYHQLFDLAVFAHLAPDVLVKGVEVVLELGGVHARFVVVGWVLVEVRHEDGLRVGGLDVFARAAVAVTARADLVVEGAVNLVLLCAEDGGEVVGHRCDCCCRSVARGGQWDGAQSRYLEGVSRCHSDFPVMLNASRRLKIFVAKYYAELWT